MRPRSQHDAFGEPPFVEGLRTARRLRRKSARVCGWDFVMVSKGVRLHAGSIATQKEVKEMNPIRRILVGAAVAGSLLTGGVIGATIAGPLGPARPRRPMSPRPLPRRAQAPARSCRTKTRRTRLERVRRAKRRRTRARSRRFPSRRVITTMGPGSFPAPDLYGVIKSKGIRCETGSG